VLKSWLRYEVVLLSKHEVIYSVMFVNFFGVISVMRVGGCARAHSPRMMLYIIMALAHLMDSYLFYSLRRH
jgi:hypothetical protein